MMFCDSHCHLDQFPDADLEGIVQRASASGVGLIVTVGTTLASSRRALQLADRFDVIYAGVGLHPQDLVAPMNEWDTQTLKELALSTARVVCISETGLDFQAASPNREWQIEAFRRHIRLARELKMPIDFHARDAYEEILPIMKEEKAEEAGAIWHYFQGDSMKAMEALDMGFYLSLAKPLLRMPELEEVTKGIPIDRIVLETDSYPQPFKKNPIRRTEPSHVVQVAEKVAQIKGLTLAAVAEVTTANLRRALRLG